MKLNIEIEAKNQASKAFQSLSKNIQQLRKDIDLLTKGHQYLYKDYKRLSAEHQRAVDLYKKYGSALEKARSAQIKFSTTTNNAVADIKKLSSAMSSVGGKGVERLVELFKLDLPIAFRNFKNSVSTEVKKAMKDLKEMPLDASIGFNNMKSSMVKTASSITSFIGKLSQIRKVYNDMKAGSVVFARMQKDQAAAMQKSHGVVISYNRRVKELRATYEHLTMAEKRQYNSLKMYGAQVGLAAGAVKMFGTGLKTMYAHSMIGSKSIISMSGAFKRLTASVRMARQGFVTWFKGGFGNLAETFRDFGRQIFYAGVQIGTFIMAMNSLFGPFVKFQKVMADISTMLVTNAPMWTAKFSAAIEQMALKTGIAVDELGQSLYNILSASIAPAMAAETLKAAGVASIAGATDVATAGKTIVSIINTYGESAGGLKNIIDQLFGAVYKGQLRFEDLAKQLGNILTVADMAEVPFNELLAAITTVTKAGLPVDETITSLRNTILTFSKATDKSFKSLGDLNIELDITWLKTHGLTGLLKELSKATSRRITDIFREKRELRGLLPLVENYSMFLEDAEYIGTKSMKGIGDATIAYVKQASTMEAQLKRLQRQFEFLRVHAFENLIPRVEHFLNVIKLLIEEFNDLDKTMKDQIVNWGMLGVIIVGLAPPLTIITFALGNLVIQFTKMALVIVGPLLKGIKWLIVGLLSLSTTTLVAWTAIKGFFTTLLWGLWILPGLAASFAMTVLPIAALVAAILSLIGVMQFWYNDNDKFVAMLVEMGEVFKSVGSYIGKYLTLAFLNLRLKIKEFVGDLGWMKTVALAVTNPLFLLVKALQGMSGAIDADKLKEEIKEVEDAIAGFKFYEPKEGLGFADFGGEVLGNLGKWLDDIRKPFADGLSWMGGKLKDFGISVLKSLPGAGFVMENIADLSNLKGKLDELIAKAKGIKFEVPDIENLVQGLQRASNAVKDALGRIQYAYKLLGVETADLINEIISNVYEYGALLWKTNNMVLASYEGILKKLEEVRAYYGYLPEELQRLQNEMVNNIYYVRKKIADELTAQIADWDNWGDNVVKGVMDTVNSVQSAFSDVLFKTLKGELADVQDIFEKVRDVILKAYSNLASEIFTSWLLKITGIQGQMKKWQKVLSGPLETHMGTLLRQSLEVNSEISKLVLNTNAVANNFKRAADEAERIAGSLKGYNLKADVGSPSYQQGIKDIGLTGNMGLGMSSGISSIDLAKDVLGGGFNASFDLTEVQKKVSDAHTPILESLSKFGEGLTALDKPMKSTAMGFKEIGDLEKTFKQFKPGDLLKRTADDLSKLPEIADLGEASEGLSKVSSKQGFLGKTMSSIQDLFKKITTPSEGGGPSMLGKGAGIATGAYGVYQATQGSGGAGGALSGAASGAAAGTMIMPGWGTAIGAVVGGVAGAVGSGDDEDKHAAEKAAFNEWLDKAKELQKTGVTIPQDYTTGGWAVYARYKTEMDKFLQDMAGIANEISSAIAGAVVSGFNAPSVAVGVEELGKKVRETMSDQFMQIVTDMITKVSSKMLTPFISALKTIEEYIGSFAVDFPNLFEDSFNQMFDTIAYAVAGLFEPIKNVFAGFVTVIGALIALTFKPVSEFIKGLVDVAASIFYVVVDSFYPVLNVLKTILVDIVAVVINKTAQAIYGLLNGFAAGIKLIAQAIDLWLNPAKFWDDFQREGKTFGDFPILAQLEISSDSSAIRIALSYILKAALAIVVAPLGIAITSMLIKSFIAALGFLFAGMMAMTELVVDILEPLFEKAYEISTFIRDMFGIYSEEMEDMIKSGFDLAKSETRRMYDEVKKMFGSLQNTLKSALKAGFEQGTKAAGWTVFERQMREGIYDAIVEGIVTSVAAFGLFMQAIGPYLDDIARLTVKAFLGVFNPDEWAALTLQLTNGAISSLQKLKPFFDDIYGALKPIENMLLHGGLPDSFYTYVEYEPPDMSWWEQLVLAIQIFLAPWRKMVDDLIGWIQAVPLAFASIIGSLFLWLAGVDSSFLFVIGNLFTWLFIVPAIFGVILKGLWDWINVNPPLWGAIIAGLFFWLLGANGVQIIFGAIIGWLIGWALKAEGVFGIILGGLFVWASGINSIWIAIIAGLTAWLWDTPTAFGAIIGGLLFWLAGVNPIFGSVIFGLMGFLTNTQVVFGAIIGSLIAWSLGLPLLAGTILGAFAGGWWKFIQDQAGIDLREDMSGYNTGGGSEPKVSNGYVPQVPFGGSSNYGSQSIVNITLNATIDNKYDTEQVAKDLGFYIERSLSQ